MQTHDDSQRPRPSRGKVKPSSGAASNDADLLKLTLAELRQKLNVSGDGLTESEAQKRLARYGPNALPDKQVSPILKFLSYFWGPIPWMIEVAVVLSAAVRHWPDMIITLVLLVFNAVVGFWQENQAANAVQALKRQLALKARVRRDGTWREIDAVELVPGDRIRLRLGDIIPADAKLAGSGFLSVDQSALTGESLPVEKKAEDSAYSGTVVKQGEMDALVAATGGSTFFGQTARLVSHAKTASHFQKAVLNIGDYLIYLSLGLAAILLLVRLTAGDSWLTLMQFVLILIVASIPVAMPAVLTVTMAIGSVALTRMKAIVTRLESIEEMAGMDVLCSDKTGTLTQNKLTLGDPELFGAKDAAELIQAGALACKTEDQDAIDQAVLAGLSSADLLKGYTQTAFIPFDPVHKRTVATVQGPNQESFQVAKGAPQVIIGMCRLKADEKQRANEAVNTLAGRGFRTLGVAEALRGENSWQFLGLLPLYDPPRSDSAETLQRAADHGIHVKMVTGDNLAIAREIGASLGLSKRMVSAAELFPEGSDPDHLAPETVTKIEEADGFAEVFPEHKYGVVKALQSRGHLLGMTGDGVNDAPALKQAEVGIAVSGATDAARAAASLVLTAPGLSVIVRAVEEARRIFERMNSYAIYRIAETIRIMIFVVLTMVVFNFYPITAIMIILLALLNDLPILTIAYDNTWLDPEPVRWNMRRVLTVATVLGLVGVFQTFLLLVIGKVWLGLDIAHLQSFIYLKLALAGHLTLLVVRNRRSALSKPYPASILLGAILGTQVLAALIVGFGLLVPALPWWMIAFIWGYALIWGGINDWIKIQTYRQLGLSSERHQSFIGRLQQTLHPYGPKHGHA
jgi:H+-transporting ATPase